MANHRLLCLSPWWRHNTTIPRLQNPFLHFSFFLLLLPLFPFSLFIPSYECPLFLSRLLHTDTPTLACNTVYASIHAFCSVLMWGLQYQTGVHSVQWCYIMSILWCLLSHLSAVRPPHWHKLRWMMHCHLLLLLYKREATGAATVRWWHNFQPVCTGATRKLNCCQCDCLSNQQM